MGKRKGIRTGYKARVATVNLGKGEYKYVQFFFFFLRDANDSSKGFCARC